MSFSISSRTWNVQLNIFTNLVFWRTLNLSFLCSVPNLVQNERHQKSKDKQKRCLTRKNSNTCRAIVRGFQTPLYWFGHPEDVPKNFISLKKNKSVILLRIYLCAFGPFQQAELISMRQNSRKCDHKFFAAAY